MANQLSAVNHIVQLMLENRSFDQMLGFLYTQAGNVSPAGQPFDGLTGNEWNPDGAGNQIKVYPIQAGDPHPYFMPGADPGERFQDTNVQLYATDDPVSGATPTNMGFVTSFASAIAYDHSMGEADALAGTTASQIMAMYPPALLPILCGLARGFAVCDVWHASAPAMTLPNRAFAAAATSQGRVDDSSPTFTCPSIFGRLTTANIDWAIFGYNRDPETRLDFPDTQSAAESHFGQFADFQARAAAGTLPAYTFLEPAWGSGGNSQHPNYDVALGEQLIRDVYTAVRAGPGWPSTLLIITYDEHGGNYDHVPPPTNATPPGDGAVSPEGFDFTRFGVRVPAVLVSPLIAAGTVFRASPIDHTSVLKTIQERFGVAALTARDAAAASLGDVLTLTTPRTDDPIAGVAAPVSTAAAPPSSAPSQLDLVFAQRAADLPVRNEQGGYESAPPVLTTSADASDFIRDRTAAWKDQLRRRQARRAQRAKDSA
jgi:phospholipase C